MRKGHGPLLDGVKGDAVEALEEGGVAAAGEQQVGEVAVEEDGDAAVEDVAHEGQAGGELVDDDGAGPQRGELRGEERDVQQEVEVAQDGAQDGQAGEDGRGDEPGAADADVEGACGGESEMSVSKLISSFPPPGRAYRRGTRRSSARGRSGW